MTQTTGENTAHRDSAKSRSSQLLMPRATLTDQESAAREAEFSEPSRLGLARRLPALDLRLKILSLVLLSALLPSLLVGVASYLTARGILTDKQGVLLSRRAELAADRVALFFQDRQADSQVFANAFIVSESLQSRDLRPDSDLGTAAQPADRVRQYLTKVRERYPLFRALAIFDSNGAPVAWTKSLHNEVPPEIPDGLLESKTSGLLVSTAEGPVYYTYRPVPGRNGLPIGSLMTKSSLEGFWQDLASGVVHEDERLRVMDASGFLLFDSQRDQSVLAERLTSKGARLCLEGGAGTAEYENESGNAVLAAYRFIDRFQMGVLVEIDSDTAFGASRRLRTFNLLVSLLATLAITALAFGVVVSLTRPIDALIAGARNAANGDLSQQIPVTSRDQIGSLTKVFNDMIRNLSRSRSRLELLSVTDELTGLYNRRHLSGMFETELSRALRLSAPLSVLMMDLDDFKAINDQFAHQEGDALLQHVGEYLTRGLRPTDVLARYGGDEFVALLPATGRHEALALAERLRKAFSNVELPGHTDSFSVAISIGVATYPEDGTTEDELIRAADAALYDAKLQGRNRVRAATPVDSLTAPAG